MGMDGISIANTGAVKEPTSAEMSNKTEQALQSSAEMSSKQVQTLSTHQRVNEREEEDEQSKGKRKGANQDEVFQDGLVEEETSEEDEEYGLDPEDLENPNKEFYVKLNVKDDIIELYDSATDRLIETISGNELGELVQKLNMASGIFVNKKV